MNRIDVQQIHPYGGQVQPRVLGGSAPGEAGQLRNLLEQTIARQDSIKFSSRLLGIDRLRSRNIILGNEDVNRLNAAVNKAEGKGSRDALILMNDMAFVVSIKNKTIITAITDDQMQDKVITNIDSTIIA